MQNFACTLVLQQTTWISLHHQHRDTMLQEGGGGGPPNLITGGGGGGSPPNLNTSVGVNNTGGGGGGGGGGRGFLQTLHTSAGEQHGGSSKPYTPICRRQQHRGVPANLTYLCRR